MMLSEVGKIFSRAFRMVFRYPIFIYLPFAYYSYNLLYYIVNAYMARANTPFGLLTLQWIDVFVDAVFLFGIPIVFILIILRASDTVVLSVIIEEAKGYFLKYIGQSLVGLILALLFSLPVGCIFLFFYSMNENLGIAALAWFWIIGFVGIGSITLGSRFLVDEGKGLIRNSIDGFRMLNGHLPFFINLYFFETLISFSNYFLRLFICSVFTGQDLSSISFSSLSSYTKSVMPFFQTPAVYVYDMIFGTFLFSFYSIVATLAYIRCKNHASLARVSNQIIAR